MDICKNEHGKWMIVHGGREIAQDFDSEDAAYTWADHNIDDQVFDRPNWFSAPLSYRRAPRSLAEDILAFLDRIEGAGYGGQSDFEIARSAARELVAREPQ